MPISIFEEYIQKRQPGLKEEPFPEDGNTGLLSYALPKSKLPETGEKFLLIETEIHPTEYINFSGNISEGYGKGYVSIIDKGMFEILDVSPSKIEIYLKGKEIEGKYAIIFTHDNNYLITKID